MSGIANPEDGMWTLDINYTPPTTEENWLPTRKLSITMRETPTGEFFLVDVSGPLTHVMKMAVMRDMLLQNLLDTARISRG